MAAAKKAAGKAAAANGAKTFVIDGKPFTCSAAQVSLYSAVGTAAGQIESIKAALHKVVSATYGETGPTYEQYSSDVRALRAQCENDGKSVEYYRATYAGAVMALYKKLPASSSPEALKKAAQRALAKRKAAQALIDAGLKKAPANWVETPLSAELADDGKSIVIPEQTASKAGAPKGQVQDQPVSVSEAVEQAIARYGIFEVLDGLTRVLGVDSDTQLAAKTLAAIGAQLRRDLKPAHAGSAPQAAPQAPAKTRKARAPRKAA